MKQQITIAILAGGESRRMGTDKALLGTSSGTLLERTATVAASTGRPVVIVGRARPDEWTVPGVDFIPDAAPGLGPIGGLLAALRYAETRVLLLACDMPHLTTEAITWVLNEADAREQSDGIAVKNGDQLEPLFSVYHPSVIPAIERRVAEHRRSLHGLIESARFEYIDAPPHVRPALVNVNTVEEWNAFGNNTIGTTT